MKPSATSSARMAAVTLLATILRDKATLDEALQKTKLPTADADSKFAVALALIVLRHLGQIDALLKPYLEKPLPPKRLGAINALRLGAAQLLWLDTPAHAAVNETVALLKKGPDAALAGLVNAVLQNIARDRPLIPAPYHNVPEATMQRWKKTYGFPRIEQMARIAAERPPLDLNTTATIENATRLDSRMLRLPATHDAIETLSGYHEGAFYVQDLAASYPVRLLGDVREHQILDLCAAPGGKTVQLAKAGGFVTALDHTGSRMVRLKENLKRMQIEANCITADLLHWQPTRAYDAVLLDAPCSATGTWRRHPEVLQLVSADDIAELVQLQRTMLTRAWQWVKPGGKLVYCVCSLEPEEGEAQAAWFAEQNPNATLRPVTPETEIPAECISPEGHLRTTPEMLAEKGGMDGFFAVCFQKK